MEAPEHAFLRVMDALVGTLESQVGLVEQCMSLAPVASVEARDAVGLLSSRISHAVQQTQGDLRGMRGAQANGKAGGDKAAGAWCCSGERDEFKESEFQTQAGYHAMGLSASEDADPFAEHAVTGSKGLTEVTDVSLEEQQTQYGSRGSHDPPLDRSLYGSGVSLGSAEIDGAKRRHRRRVKSDGDVYERAGSKGSVRSAREMDKEFPRDVKLEIDLTRDSQRSASHQGPINLLRPPKSDAEREAAEKLKSSFTSLSESAKSDSRLALGEEDIEVDLGLWVWRVGGVLNPNWIGRLSWDIGVILLVVFDAMILPFQMAYKDSNEDEFDRSWVVLTTVFFSMDICVSFMTGFTASENDPRFMPGSVVVDKKQIAKVYLRTWFPIDFMSTIPWGLLGSALVKATGGSESNRSADMAKLTKIVKFVRFLRLIRMLRLAKLAAIWDRLEANLGSLVLKQSIGLLRVILVLIAICHWNACIFWLIGQEKSLLNDLMTSEDFTAWQQMSHWTTTPRLDGQLWTEQDTFSQYIFCFYWTLGVMRTMPSEVWPVNNVERVYVMVFMFFAFSAFAICVALITQTFFKFSERKRMYDEDMSSVRMFMRKIKCSETVQQSVKSYCRHLFDNRKILAKESNMLNILPKTIQLKIKYERLKDHFRKFTILSSLPPSAVLMICEMAEVRDLHPGVCICRAGMVTESAWLCLNGRLKATGLETDSECSQHAAYAEHVINENCLFSEGDYASPFTVTTVTSAELMKIEKHSFLSLVQDADELKLIMNFISRVDSHRDEEDPWSSWRQRQQRAKEDSSPQDGHGDGNMLRTMRHVRRSIRRITANAKTTNDTATAMTAAIMAS